MTAYLSEVPNGWNKWVGKCKAFNCFCYIK
jgi:hypothetical protein